MKTDGIWPFGYGSTIVRYVRRSFRNNQSTIGTQMGGSSGYMMEIVENSYYEHDEHGLVKVVDVTDGEVLFEKHESTTVVNGEIVYAGGKQETAEFQEDASPADLSVSADKATFNLIGTQQ